MFSELSKERCKICRHQLQLSVVNVFSLVSILFRYFLHYGVRLISAWSAAHLYVEVSTQFSGIVDIITTTALYRVINKAVMMYFDPSTADILAGAHSIEFPAYHYYVATSPPATSPAHENFTVAIFSARPAGTMPPLRRAGAGGYLVKISEKIPGYSPARRHTPTEQCVASPCDMAVTNSNKQTKL